MLDTSPTSHTSRSQKNTARLPLKLNPGPTNLLLHKTCLVTAAHCRFGNASESLGPLNAARTCQRARVSEACLRFERRPVNPLAQTKMSLAQQNLLHHKTCLVIRKCSVHSSVARTCQRALGPVKPLAQSKKGPMGDRIEQQKQGRYLTQYHMPPLAA